MKDILNLPPQELQQLYNKVVEIATERPDVTYPGFGRLRQCYYNRGKCSDGSRGCIIGQAAKALDIQMPEFPESESITHLTAHINRELAIFLGFIQKSQDAGDTWGVALTHARLHTKEIHDDK